MMLLALPALAAGEAGVTGLGLENTASLWYNIPRDPRSLGDVERVVRRRRD